MGSVFFPCSSCWESVEQSLGLQGRNLPLENPGGMLEWPLPGQAAPGTGKKGKKSQNPGIFKVGKAL